MQCLVEQCDPWCSSSQVVVLNKSTLATSRLERGSYLLVWSCCWLQVKSVKQVAEYVSQLRRVGPGLGVWEFDRKLGADVNAVA
jgi:hypothetical protein